MTDHSTPQLQSVDVDTPPATTGAVPAGAPTVSGGVDRSGSTWTQVRRRLGFRNMSAVYVFVVVFVVFAIHIPDTFLSTTTWRTLLDNQVITALTALALVVPLSAGVFNLAIGFQVSAASVLSAWLLVDRGMPIPVAIVMTLAGGAAIGVVCAWLVVNIRIDSFIATLGIGSLLAAFITWISDGQQILGVPDSLADFGRASAGGVTYAFMILIATGVVVWYFLERTPSGRRVYATGGNIEAARLAGVNTTAVIFGSLAACGILAAGAGVLLTARLGNADPTLGPGYLVPAFTAAFLGSTQFRGGRFNVWGTLLSVYVLAAGVKGLQLSGAPVWIPDLFNGVALLVAVGLAKYQGSNRRFASIRRTLRLGPTQPARSKVAQETP